MSVQITITQGGLPVRFTVAEGRGPRGPKGDTPTAEDIGLGNVDNTSDADKPVSTAQAAADATVAANAEADIENVQSELTEHKQNTNKRLELDLSRYVFVSFLPEDLSGGEIVQEGGFFTLPSFSHTATLGDLGLRTGADDTAGGVFSGPLIPETDDFSLSVLLTIDERSWSNEHFIVSQFTAGISDRWRLSIQDKNSDEKRIKFVCDGFAMHHDIYYQDWIDSCGWLTLQVSRKGDAFALLINGKAVDNHVKSGISLLQTDFRLCRDDSGNYTSPNARVAALVVTDGLEESELLHVAETLKRTIPKPTRSGMIPMSEVARIDATDSYFDSPWLLEAENGDLICGVQVGRPATPSRTHLYRSFDFGRTWNFDQVLDGLWAGKPFKVSGELHVIGIDEQWGNIVVFRSVDSGRTWTSGQILAGTYVSGGATSVFVDESNNRIFAAFERTDTGSHPARYAFALQATVGSVLTDSASWTASNEIDLDTVESGLGVLEGNAFKVNNGGTVSYKLIYRVKGSSYKDKALLIDYSFGTNACSNARFLTMPVEDSKFWIQAIGHHTQEKLLLLHNSNTQNRRTRLVISKSTDNAATFQEVMLISSVPEDNDESDRSGFMYPTPYIINGGEDLAFVVRTSTPEGSGNFHNADRIEFFLIRDYVLQVF